jgi:hypothetical protein
MTELPITRRIMDRKVPHSWQRWNTIVNILLLTAAVITLMRAVQ